MTDNLITIKTFSSEIEAHIAQGKLEAVGIKSFLFKDDCGGMRPHLQTTIGIELKVCHTKAKKAAEFLAENEHDLRIAYDPKENTIAILSHIGVVAIGIGIAFLLVGLSDIDLKIAIGGMLLFMGIGLEIYSRKLKRKKQN